MNDEKKLNIIDTSPKTEKESKLFRKDVFKNGQREITRYTEIDWDENTVEGGEVQYWVVGLHIDATPKANKEIQIPLDIRPFPLFATSLKEAFEKYDAAASYQADAALNEFVGQQRKMANQMQGRTPGGLAMAKASDLGKLPGLKG